MDGCRSPGGYLSRISVANSVVGSGLQVAHVFVSCVQSIAFALGINLNTRSKSAGFANVARKIRWPDRGLYISIPSPDLRPYGIGERRRRFRIPRKKQRGCEMSAWYRWTSDVRHAYFSPSRTGVYAGYRLFQVPYLNVNGHSSHSRVAEVRTSLSYLVLPHNVYSVLFPIYYPLATA